MVALGHFRACTSRTWTNEYSEMAKSDYASWRCIEHLEYKKGVGFLLKNMCPFSNRKSGVIQSQSSRMMQRLGKADVSCVSAAATSSVNIKHQFYPFGPAQGPFGLRARLDPGSVCAQGPFRPCALLGLGPVWALGPFWLRARLGPGALGWAGPIWAGPWNPGLGVRHS